MFAGSRNIRILYKAATLNAHERCKATDKALGLGLKVPFGFKTTSGVVFLEETLAFGIQRITNDNEQKKPLDSSM